MLTMTGRSVHLCDKRPRRDFLSVGSLALGGLSLPQLLQAEERAGVRSSHKSVIMIYLTGGPPHLDMVDLKPGAPSEIRGEFQPISTNVPGMHLLGSADLVFNQFRFRELPDADMKHFVDYLEADGASLRAAAQAALAKADPDTFMTVLSGLDVDKDWSVRAGLATTLAGLPPDIAALRLDQLARDADPKVRAAALSSLAALKVPGTDTRLVGELAHADPVVRMAAARGLAALKPAGAGAALARAYEASAADTTYVARAAILGALAAVDPVAAAPLLRAALTDKEWALRVRAAALLRESDAASLAAAAGPAPSPVESALDDTAPMIAPAFSPQAYVQTSRGEFRIELAVIDAPRTVANFVALAGRGFFDGIAWHRIVPDFVAQVGDPRGDGEGGPGYTIRDELNQRPYLRGAVGMALDWRDTGGSQFFVTLSPQPHLDARYTVFGHVVAGMDVVDRLEPWDRITSVRVWDGTRWIGAGTSR